MDTDVTDPTMDEKSLVVQTKRIAVGPFKCEVCQKSFGRKDSMKRHHARVHKLALQELAAELSKTKTRCIHPDCDKVFYHKTKMVKHLEEDHCVSSKSSQHQFSTMKDFFEWKEKEETANFVYFSKQFGDTIGKSARYSYYICQHDGSGKPHRARGHSQSRIARKNKKGQVKTGATCPARMRVKMDLSTGQVTVSYLCMHSHEPTFRDTQHHPVLASVKADIQGKLAQGIPATRIRRELRDGLGEGENRDSEAAIGHLRAHQFVSKHIMHEKSRGMNVNSRLHPEDNMSTFLLIQKLELESFNPVLLYKPQGDRVYIGDPNIGDLPDAKEVFAVGLQTKQQLEMMDKKEIMCIDSTQETNRYGFHLLNILVPDEFGKGYPVGHLISNYQDEKLLIYFFSAIKMRTPDFKIHSILSNDDVSVRDAIKAVFWKDGIKHLLHKSHIQQDWQQRLEQEIPTDDALRQDVHQCLVSILEEQDPNKFRQMTAAFKIMHHCKCPNFVDYLFSNYMHRPQAWAMCHRDFLQACTDTNTFTEDYYNRLKPFFSKRTQKRRIDDLINLLLEIEEENFWRRKGDIQNKLGLKRETDSRHNNGMKIPDKDIERLGQDEWKIRSQSSPHVWNTLTTLQSSCDKDHCFEKCHELSCVGLCSHIYQCNCEDSSHLCKHVHKVHAFKVRMLQRTKTPARGDEHGGQCLYETDLVEEVVDVNPEDSKETMLEATAEYLKQLQEFLHNEQVTSVLLPQIHGALKRTVAKCSAVASKRPRPKKGTQV